jgi:hypothetical protein
MKELSALIKLYAIPQDIAVGNVPRTDEIAVSAYILAETLDTVCSDVWGALWGEMPNIVFRLPETLIKDFYGKYMLKAGWCCRDLSLLQLPASGATGLYFASRIRRDIPEGFHAACSDKACVARQIDETTYITSHTDPDCKYSHVHIDLERLTSIIGAGKIPRIAIHQKSEDYEGIELDVADLGDFTAISRRCFTVCPCSAD